jgi:CheY-like chemotaxis protein
MLRKIYIVDDDEISIFLTEAVLERQGYLGRIERYYNPAEALPNILSAELDGQAGRSLLFLDLNMPRISGWDFLEKLSEYEVQLLGKCHVVILSSAVDGREILKSSQFPLVLNFVPKPLDDTAFELILELLQENSPEL